MGCLVYLGIWEDSSSSQIKMDLLASQVGSSEETMEETMRTLPNRILKVAFLVSPADSSVGVPNLNLQLMHKDSKDNKDYSVD